MITRVTLIIMFLMSFAGLAAIAVFALKPAAPAATHVLAPKEVEVAVLVTTRPVHAGQLLRPPDISTRKFPTASVPPGALLDKPEERGTLNGALVRVTLPDGGLILSQDLVLPGDHSYLAAVLMPGSRAISIGVDAISGVAGLVWPGDHVDLILTETLDDPTIPSGHRFAAETVMSGLRVIATNQDLVRGEQPASNGTGERTITLEATPQQAERVSMASRLGHLSLSVCSTDTCQSTQTRTSLTWASDVSPALAKDGHDAGATLHIFNGVSEQKDFHF